MTSLVGPALTAAGAWLLTTGAHAAGGHFDVDDAPVLDPGHCQYETWLARAPSTPATLFHLGPGCRLGPVEVGFNYDRLAVSGDTRASVGPQLKWVADPLLGAFSAGVAWTAAHDLGHGGRPAHTLYAPVTWVVNDRVALNANVGADWSFAGARTRRLGVSGEWIAQARLTLIGERVKFADAWTSRLGARFMVDPSISIDLSAARVGPRATHLYVLGLNHDFAR